MEGFSCKPRTNHHYQPDSVQAHVRAAVEPLLDAFGVSNDDYPKRKKERSCYGHKEKIFGIAMSHCGNFCATAGQDSIVIIWDLQQNNKLLYQLPHDKRYECLRVAWASPRWAAESLERKGDNNPANLAEKYYILATSAADGTVRLWGCKDPRSTANKWSCHVLLDHSVLLGRLPPELDEDGRMMEEDNKPQIYSLQFIDPSPPRHPELVMDEHYNNSLLLTSSDEYVHLWEVITETDEKINLSTNNSPESLANQWRLSEALSMHFSSTSYEGYGVTPCHITEPGWMPPPPPGSDVSGGKAAFGGERNPEGLIFVFDASHCPANGLLAAALSDGTIRITNRQGRCLSILNLPGGGPQSHVLSFCWDRTGTRLATCVGSGHLVTWHLDGYSVQYQGLAIATCISVLEGGHEPGRPLFGCCYVGEREDLLMSWGMDGRLCVWDALLMGNVPSPIAVLKHDEKYPIFAVQVTSKQNDHDLQSSSPTRIAVGGGPSEGGFIGVPLYLYDITRMPSIRDLTNVSTN